MAPFFRGSSFMREILGYLHRASLWPKLALAVGTGFLLLFAVFGFLSLRIVGDSMERILQKRLTIAEMVAQGIDRLVATAFYELEKAVSFAAFDPQAADLSAEEHMLAHAYGRVGSFSLGVYFLDRMGKVVLAHVGGLATVDLDFASRPEVSRILETGERGVTTPFADPTTGKTAIAVIVPVKDKQGQQIAWLGGLIDLSSPAIREMIHAAVKLEKTGHAELVDENGMVVATTEKEDYWGPGEHLSFYLRMGREKRAGVETVPYDTGNGAENDDGGPLHVMAYAPLSMVPWGLAVGGDHEETFAPVIRLRNSILFFGTFALLAVSFATLIGTWRLLLKPLRALTESARRISAGDLNSPIGVHPEGEIGLLADTFEDMRVKLAESLRELTLWGTEMEERVRLRTAELVGVASENRRLIEEIGKLEAVREMDRLRAEFVSNVSHELKTPLGFIKGYASTLLRADLSPTQDTRREFLQIIMEESEKLQELVDNLLDTARLQAGKLGVDKKLVDIPSIALLVVERARTTTAKHRLAVEFPPDFPRVLADRQRLEQVLNNLVDNAIKFAPRGGQITLRGESGDGFAKISVQDEGEGIPPGELGRVFEPFHRVNNPAVHHVRGSGLGLSICRGIVEAHGGSIGAESTPGRGSTFVFTLPLRPSVSQGGTDG